MNLLRVLEAISGLKSVSPVQVEEELKEIKEIIEDSAYYSSYKESPLPALGKRLKKLETGVKRLNDEYTERYFDELKLKYDIASAVQIGLSCGSSVTGRMDDINYMVAGYATRYGREMTNLIWEWKDRFYDRALGYRRSAGNRNVCGESTKREILYDADFSKIFGW